MMANVVDVLMRSRSIFACASRLLWAAPCSLLGLLLGSFALIAGGQMRWVDGALECWLEEGVIASWLQRSQPFAAITLGHVIFALRAEDLQLWHAHERVHVRQYENWGVVLLLAYPVASLWAWLHGHDPYWANCFEREAYLAETGGST